MSDEFKNSVSFDCYLNCVLIKKPGKLGVVNHIKKKIKREAKQALVKDQGRKKQNSLFVVCSPQISKLKKEINLLVLNMVQARCT